MDAQEQLAKMVSDYKDLSASSEADISSNIEEIKKGCSEDQVSFITDSLDSARSGKLDLKGFMNNLKMFNNAS